MDSAETTKAKRSTTTGDVESGERTGAADRSFVVVGVVSGDEAVVGDSVGANEVSPVSGAGGEVIGGIVVGAGGGFRLGWAVSPPDILLPFGPPLGPLLPPCRNRRPLLLPFQADPRTRASDPCNCIWESRSRRISGVSLDILVVQCSRVVMYQTVLELAFCQLHVCSRLEAAVVVGGIGGSCIFH